MEVRIPQCVNKKNEKTVVKIESKYKVTFLTKTINRFLFYTDSGLISFEFRWSNYAAKRCGKIRNKTGQEVGQIKEMNSSGTKIAIVIEGKQIELRKRLLGYQVLPLKWSLTPTGLYNESNELISKINGIFNQSIDIYKQEYITEIIAIMMAVKLEMTPSE